MKRYIAGSFVVAAVLVGCDKDAASRTVKQRPVASSHQSSSRQKRQKHSAEKPAVRQEPEVAARDPESEKWDEVIARMQPRQCNPDGWCTVYELPPRSGKWVGSIWPKDGQIFIAGGYGAVVHFDGRQWRFYDTPASTKLFQIRGSGVNDMYAVGTMLTIVHWDGNTWKAELGPKGTPRNSHCGISSVVALGDVYVSCTHAGKERIYHREDGKWLTVEKIPDTIPLIDDPGPPEPLRDPCSKPQFTWFERSGRDVIAVCTSDEIYRADEGGQVWHRFGREGSTGSYGSFWYFRMGNRWIGRGPEYAVFRDIGGGEDPEQSWTRLPYPEKLKRPQDHLLLSDTGPAYFFSDDGGVHVYDGKTWTSESTGTKPGIRNAERLGNTIMATAHNRILIKKLDGSAKVPSP